MMKRKNWKKTAAFVTSLTMATTMMPAEIGSVLVHALPVAGTNDNNGTKNVSLGDAAPFVTGVKISDATKSNEFNATLIAADADKKFGLDGGTKLEITSKFPLSLFAKGKSYDINEKYVREAVGPNHVWYNSENGCSFDTVSGKKIIKNNSTTSNGLA